jgi:hypothetical protein
MNPLQEPTQGTQPLPNTPTNTNGYTQLPLPSLLPTDICILSDNINTLHTITPAELGTTLDLYQNWIPQLLAFKNVIKTGASTPQQRAPFVMH